MSKIIDSPAEFKKYRASLGSKSVALVPTMGALHEGHLSLVEKAKGLADEVVMSIFVNPTQFAPGEDFERYPRCLARDVELGSAAGVHTFFTPSVESMYPQGFRTIVQADPALANVLEGKTRPSHFKGVCTVVLKLFQIIQPQVAVFGLKDYQQFRILSQMVTDLNLTVEMVGAPIFREVDGLAMSSRNQYLSTADRQHALCLSQSLWNAETRLIAEPNAFLRDLELALAEKIQETPGAVVDYVQFVDPLTLLPQSGNFQETLLLLAVYLGKVRLIDNLKISLHSRH